MAAHHVCLHVPAADRLQHEEAHVQDALQGGRPGKKNEGCFQATSSEVSLTWAVIPVLCLAGETHFIH